MQSEGVVDNFFNFADNFFDVYVYRKFQQDCNIVVAFALFSYLSLYKITSSALFCRAGRLELSQSLFLVA